MKLHPALFLFSIFSFLFVLLAADTPKEAVGFFGNITGTVKSVKPDGTSFTLQISAAEPSDKSLIKDPKPMIGKIVSLGTRMPKTNGVAHNHPDDVAYIKSLKPGDQITVTIFEGFDV